MRQVDAAARAVRAALAATDLTDPADRAVDELSGGQRQRAWIAMAIARETSVLLLDEPTTYLDLAHQIDVLDLVVDLNRTEGRSTVLMVLHDLDHACRYADHLIARKAGRAVAQGPPADVVDAALVTDVFGLRCEVAPDPVTGTPMVIPIGRHLGPGAARTAGAGAKTAAPPRTPDPAGPPDPGRSRKAGRPAGTPVSAGRDLRPDTVAP